MHIDRQIPLKDITELGHACHGHDHSCMKSCIDSFQLQFEVDETSIGDISWEAAFSLKDLRTINRDEALATLVCSATSIFRLLYTQADSVGNPAISLKMMFGDKNEIDQKLTRLFNLSLMKEIEEEPSTTPIFLDDRAISHSYAYLSKDLSQGTLYFTFNDPQVEQMEKIILLFSTLFPGRDEVADDSYCVLT